MPSLSLETVPGIIVKHLVCILHHTKIHIQLGMYVPQQITPLSQDTTKQHSFFLPHYLIQIGYITADSQGVLRVTLVPTFIPNFNYVIMVSE